MGCFHAALFLLRCTVPTRGCSAHVAMSNVHRKIDMICNMYKTSYIQTWDIVIISLNGAIIKGLVRDVNGVDSYFNGLFEIFTALINEG